MHIDSPIQLDARQLPEEGLALAGETDVDVFGLPEGPVRYTGPLAWELFACRDGEEIVVTGTVSADFEMECGRCLGLFASIVKIDNFSFDFPVETAEIVDLTERIREDILLGLPDNPRCDDHGGLECPAAGKFPTEDDFVPLKETVEGKKKDNVWGALDALDAPSPPNQEN